jgi:hypothetical protein
MDEYTKNFEKDGFDTLRGVATIDEDDLVDMRVKKGHRRVVLSHIEELRMQLAALDEWCISTGRDLEHAPSLEMLAQVAKPAISTPQPTTTASSVPPPPTTPVLASASSSTNTDPSDGSIAQTEGVSSSSSTAAE